MFLFNLPTAFENLKRAGIVYEPRLCSRVRFPRSKCDDCLLGCPAGALSWDKTLTLAEEKCTSCGLCISCCPNGVFWGRRRGDSALAQEISRLLSDNSSNLAIFSCAQSGQVDKNIIFLPCLGRLTENLLLAPFASGAIRVEIWWPECHGCPNEKNLSHLEAVLLLGRKLAVMVGQGEDCIQVVRTGRYSELRATPSPRLSRRDFFRNLRNDAAEAIASLLPELRNERPASPLVHMIGAKRVHLLRILKGFPQHTSTCVERKGLPVAEIEIHSGCVGCPVCAALCPTGALERTENNEGADIYFRPEICIGCQICQGACLFQAISLSANFDLQKLAIGDRRHIVHLSRKECRVCVADFLSVDEEICPACRQKKGETTLLSMGGR